MEPATKMKAVAVAVCLAGIGALAAFSFASYLLRGREVGVEASVASAAAPERQVPARDRGASLKVMTLNLAHGRKDGPNQILQRGATIRSNLDEVAAVLRRERPDVVALQEADGPCIWSGNFNHVRYLAREAGFPHWTRGEHVKARGLSYGTGLLSAFALKDSTVFTFAPSPPTFRKGFVVGTINWPAGSGAEIDLVSVHLDFSRKSVRQKQAREMIDRLSPRKRPLIVMGDFNCEWTAKEPTVRMIAEGLDLRAHRPEAADMNTFGLWKKRLDWILISPGLEFSTYGTLADTVSDHLAVVSELRAARE